MRRIAVAAAILMAGTGAAPAAGSAREILYIDHRGQIAAVNPATGDTRVMSERARGFAKFGDAEWSADGSRIAAVAAGERTHRAVVVMDARGRHPHLLTARDGFSRAPSWSSDGKQIAYIERIRSSKRNRVLCGPSYTVLRKRAVAGGPARTLYPELACEDTLGSRPAWSPDGRHLAVDVTGGIASLAIRGPKNAVVVGGSHDAYEAAPSWVGNDVIYGDEKGIYALAADLSHSRVLVRAPDLGAPVAAPDGHTVAGVIPGFPEHDRLYTADVASGAVEQLPVPPGVIGSVTWAPDSSALAFTYTTDQYDEASLYIYSLRTRALVRLRGTRGASGPTWGTQRQDF